MILAVKIIDDILLISTDPALHDIITRFGSTFKLVRVVHGLGALCFYGLNIIEDKDFSVPIHCDDKFNGLEP